MKKNPRATLLQIKAFIDNWKLDKAAHLTPTNASLEKAARLIDEELRAA